jgi:hypothetical protein
MTNRAAILLALILGAAPAFGAEAPSCPSTGTRVFLTTQGVVTLNGQKIDASKLQGALKALKPRPTIICYSRENGTGEPHPSMKTVLDAIMSTKLPIGLFTDSTFKTPVKAQ